MRRGREVVVAASVAVALGTLGAHSRPAAAAWRTAVPPCAASHLTVALGNTQAAAGNVGFPVLVTNHGSSACSFFGYADVVAHTRAPSPCRAVFVHVARSQIYRTTTPRPVVASPHGAASVGITYVDALNQGMGHGPRCLVDAISVR